MRDAKDFDVHVWFYAVGIVMGAMVLLGLTVCILLVRDCYEDDGLAGAYTQFSSNDEFSFFKYLVFC